MIELFPHNEKGYEELVNSLKNNNFSFIERATGTGKSFILIKYMVEHMANKRVLFVTLHDSMFKQLTERDMLSLGTSKDIYEKLDCVLYSSIGKHTANWYYENYDCIIFDEAHHCGAPKWGTTVGELRDLIKNSEDKKMIGATATGIRYLDNYMDVASEYFDGNVASRLSITEAILNEILPAPYYINNNSYIYDYIRRLQQKLLKLKNYKELDNIREIVSNYEEDIKKKAKPNTLFKKYGVKSGDKYIIFCDSIEDLERKMIEVDHWFLDIAPLEKFEVHSLQSNEKNQQQIDSFEKNNNSESIKLMFAVDMFNEGLHIKGVDGIIMSRKTTSPILYLQQLGRALSFSSRKKQIKIFDLVGNASQIDIIYNLYKELISNAKNALEQNHDNEEHFKKIIDRFQIVDSGNELFDELEKINSFLDENYFNKEKIKRYIFILKNYMTNSNKNFMDLLHSGEVDKEHLIIYNALRKLSDSLTYEDYIELNKLGIIISDYQNNNIILEKIKLRGSFKNVNDFEIKDIINRYNLFYIKNNRRPTENDDKDLVTNYRVNLSRLNKNTASKYLRNVVYSLNVEELIILREYPTLDSINEYLSYVEEKYKKGLILDALERKTIESISKIVDKKDKPMIFSLFNNKVLKLDESIKILKEYKDDNPNETFDNLDKFISVPNVKVALEYLHKYAIYVTNFQFELLLNMKISLPEEIDMTLEERKKELGEYQSFFEKGEKIKNSVTKSIVEFIKKHKRRPNGNIADEHILSNSYSKFFNDKDCGSVTQIITKTLLEEKIPLTIDEKIMSGLDIGKKDLEIINAMLLSYFNNGYLDNYNYELVNKMIQILKNHNYIDERLTNIWKKTNNLINYILNYKSSFNENLIKSYLFNNQSLIPFALLNYINNSFGITFDKVRLKNNNQCVNLAHQKYVIEKNKFDEYMDYILQNKKRPDVTSKLNIYIRDYLAKANLKSIKNYSDLLNSLEIPLTLEESYLIGITSKESDKKLYDIILDKKNSNGYLDLLEQRIFDVLNVKFTYGYDVSIECSDNLINDINNDLKNDIIKDIEQRVKNNPNEEIDFSNIYISESAKEKLRIYRIICLSKSFITKLINDMKKERKSYNDLLDSKNLELLELMIKYCKSNNENLELINELIKLNREIVLENLNIDIGKFIIEYVDYIKKYNREPNINSDDEYEYSLAYKYETLKEVLSIDEKKDMITNINKAIDYYKKDYFYDKFIEFIENNQRFPILNGDSEFEIKLAQDYQKIGAKLSVEQRKVINVLMRKYQLSTILYVDKKKGKKI